MGIQINGANDTINATDGSLSTNDITINNLTGVAATFTGVLTYEDVTNIDSVGVITARQGIVATGIVTATSFQDSTGVSVGVAQSTRTLQAWLFGGG